MIFILAPERHLSPWPHDSPVYRNGGDQAWIERHPSAPLGRQQRLGLEVANPEEDQLAAADSLKAHSAEPDMGRPTGVLGEDALGSFDVTSGLRMMRVPDTNSMSNGYAFISVIPSPEPR